MGTCLASHTALVRLRKQIDHFIRSWRQDFHMTWCSTDAIPLLMICIDWHSCSTCIRMAVSDKELLFFLDLVHEGVWL